eukprot:2627971-Pleurochrysis_carterae.AAC.1
MKSCGSGGSGGAAERICHGGDESREVGVETGGQANRATPFSENILSYFTIRSGGLAKIGRAQAR